jgi:hypothetical protein
VILKSLIHLFISAMGQQVTKDVRSRLEHCTLEELLDENKVIFISLMGEFRRLTTCSLLTSFSGISQGCLRDHNTSLQNVLHYGRIHYLMIIIQVANLICYARRGIPERTNLVHYGQSSLKTSASLRVLQRHSSKTIVIYYAGRPKTVLTFSLLRITTNTLVPWK